VNTNTRPAPCSACGETVAPGEGRLWWEAGANDGGDVTGRDGDGYHAGHRVEHLDAAVCSAAKARAQTARLGVAVAAKAFRQRAAAISRTFWLGQPGVEAATESTFDVIAVREPQLEHVQPHPSLGGREYYLISAERIFHVVRGDGATSRPRTPELEAEVRALVTGPQGP
jgi:hypothetical protein